MNKTYIQLNNVNISSNILGEIYKFCKLSTLKILSATNSFFRKVVISKYKHVIDIDLNILIFVSDDLILFKYYEDKINFEIIKYFINKDDINRNLLNINPFSHYFTYNDDSTQKVLSNISSLFSSLNIIKYIHEKYNILDKLISLNAAVNGSIECLKYGYEYDCVWDTRICYNSAEYNNYDCLLFAIENNCSCEDDICLFTVSNTDLKCLEYLLSIGFKCSEHIFISAIENKNMKAISYLTEKGYNYKNLSLDI